MRRWCILAFVGLATSALIVVVCVYARWGPCNRHDDKIRFCLNGDTLLSYWGLQIDPKWGAMETHWIALRWRDSGGVAEYGRFSPQYGRAPDFVSFLGMAVSYGSTYARHDTFMHITSVRIALTTIAIAGVLCTWLLCAPLRKELRNANRRSRGLCIRCGYSLAGNSTGVCPECGTRA